MHTGHTGLPMPAKSGGRPHATLADPLKGLALIEHLQLQLFILVAATFLEGKL